MSDEDTRQNEDGEHFLTGHMLIAMPQMPDPRFQRSLIYLCAHSEEGAMGLMVNRQAENLKIADLFEKLSIPLPESDGRQPIRFGGPVETGRGFVLHSGDYHADDASMRVDVDVSMTATMEILHAIGRGEGPARAIVALGYTGWGPGQLEMELRQNGWLACDPDPSLLFDDEHGDKWSRALSKLGISAALLSGGGTA